MYKGKTVDNNSHGKKKLFINVAYPKSKEALNKKKGPIVGRSPAGVE
jgi:hypothetical protein